MPITLTNYNSYSYVSCYSAKIEYYLTQGRHGKGSIFVFAAGNGGLAGDNCAFNGYANSIHTIAISGVNWDGRVPDYSEKCSAIMAVTYGQNVLTYGNVKAPIVSYLFYPRFFYSGNARCSSSLFEICLGLNCPNGRFREQQNCEKPPKLWELKNFTKIIEDNHKSQGLPDPVNRASFCLLELGGEKKALSEPRKALEVAIAQTSGLVNLPLSAYICFFRVRASVY